MLFVIDNLLGPSELEQVTRLMRQARFIDGRATASAAKQTKNNREMEVSDDYLTLVGLLDRTLDSCAKLNMRLLPRYRTHPIVNRYDAGMYYAEHVDIPIQGGMTQAGRSPGRFGQNFIRTDYSMTLFLSEPDTYDGGELELRLLDEPRSIKLRAGSGVCYATGIPHSVRQVTRGSRVAAIYWFQSLIRDVQLRHEIWEQYQLEEKLNHAGQRELAAMAGSIRANMVRYLAEL